MKLKFNTLNLILATIALTIIFGSSFVFAQVWQEKFIYDSRSKRDPFIPLLDEKSPTGIRTIFAPLEKKVRLPLEITVKGILWNGREYFAIVNDEVVKKGEYLGEVGIKDIEKDKVILEYNEREFTVFLRKEKEK